jgi:hypothetical protein
VTVLPFRAAATSPVDQDGTTVLLWGVPLHRLGSETNAARAADALQTLVDLGLLTPRGRLRAGLQASVESLAR